MRSTDGPASGRLRAKLAAVATGSFLRFFTASLFGLALDVGLATLINLYAGVPLIPSAAISLMVAAVVMYLVHEFWTFREGARRLSAERMAGTIASAFIALALRAACLYATSDLLGLGERFAPMQLLCATGLSFIANYLVVRRIVSGRRPTS